MSFRIHTIRKIREEFTVELEAVQESDDEKQIIELPASSLESILQGNEELLNIARNLANRPEEQIDPADYIDKVKEELIESGKLGPDNYIDEQKRMQEMEGDEQLSYENSNKEQDAEKDKDSKEMAANYQGPTRIYYEMAGRNHLYLPIPIYKCRGSGKVVLKIEVNQKGIVEDASIIETVSTTTDPCLVETALSTAKISRFNPDIGAPRIQTGTLTYHFVAQ
jgi:TonB family protein